MSNWQRYRHRREIAGSGWARQRLRDRILDRDGYQCRWCGAPATVLDHIHGVAAGGTDDDANLVGSCSNCNERRRQEQARAGRADTQRQRAAEPHPGLLT